MKKVSTTLTTIFLSLGLVMCSGSNDPLDDFYGSYLSACIGDNIQLYADAQEDGDLAMAGLLWSDAPCTGTYELRDVGVEGAPVTNAPQVHQTFENVKVAGIPKDLYVLEIKELNNAQAAPRYAVFYIEDDSVASLVEYDTRHTTWDQWLTEDSVPEFAEAPDTYVPAEGSAHSVIRLSRVDGLPNT